MTNDPKWAWSGSIDPLIQVQRCASIAYIIVLCLTVMSRSSIKMVERIQLVFSRPTILHLSYIVYEGNSGYWVHHIRLCIQKRIFQITGELLKLQLHI